MSAEGTTSATDDLREKMLAAQQAVRDFYPTWNDSEAWHHDNHQMMADLWYNELESRHNLLQQLAQEVADAMEPGAHRDSLIAALGETGDKDDDDE